MHYTDIPGQEETPGRRTGGKREREWGRGRGRRRGVDGEIDVKERNEEGNAERNAMGESPKMVVGSTLHYYEYGAITELIM